MPALKGVVDIDNRRGLKALRDVRREMLSVAKTPTRIKLDDGDASKVISRFRRDFSRLTKDTGKKISIGVQTEAKSALSALKSVQKALKDIGKDPRIVITVDTTQAKRASKEVTEEEKKQAQAAKDAARAKKQADKESADERKRIDRDLNRQREAALREFVRQEKEAERARVRADREAADAIKRQEREVEAARKRTTKALRDQVSAGKAAAGQLGDQFSANATRGGLAILGGLALATREAVQFEHSFADVRKTVRASDADLDSLSDTIQQMSLTIPVGTDTLNQIAADAGQLGINGTRNIAKFTRVVADLSIATKLTAEDGATSMAKLANITQMPQSEFDRLGSTIARLGNIGASTETEILDMGMRIAGAGHKLGMTEPEILGVANALSSLGILAESGGTAFSRSLTAISRATATGSEELKGFAKVAGMSEASFKKLFDKNATEAITRFIDGLSKLKGGEFYKTLDSLGLKSVRVSDTLTRAAGAGKLLRDSITQGNDAWKKNTDLVNMANERYKTNHSRLIISQNQFRALGVTVGNDLIPALNDALKVTSGLFKWFHDLTPESQTNIVKFTALAGITLLLAGRAKGLVDTIALMRTAYVGLRAAQALAMADGATGAGRLGISLANLVVGTNSAKAGFVSLRVAGVGGLAALGVAIAAVTIAVLATKTAVEGTRDASRMSDAELRKQWGVWADIWIGLSSKVADFSNWLNRLGRNPLIDKILSFSPALSLLRNNFSTNQADNPNADKAAYSNYAQGEKRHGRTPLSYGDYRERYLDGSHADGSFATGLDYVPRDGFIARLHKGEKILTAKEASDYRASGLSGRIDALQSKIDSRRLQRSQTGVRKSDPELMQWVQQLRDLKKELAATNKEINSSIRQEKDALRDLTAMYEAQARAAEKSADASVKAAEVRLEKLGELREGFKEIFGEVQSQLVSQGDVSNALEPYIKGLEDLLSIGGKSGKIVADARRQWNAFQKEAYEARQHANSARSEQEQLSGLDGFVPGGGRGTTGDAVGDKIAAEAVRMQRVAHSFVRQCDRLADKTVNSVTSTFNKIMGPRAGDTAARTMARFMAAGIGFAATGAYAPGDIVYSGATKKNSAGHVQIIGPDGRFYDQYGAHAKPTTRPQWVVRSGSGGTYTAAQQTALRPLSYPVTSVEDAPKFDLSAITGSLSSYRSLPKSWGVPVKSSDLTSTRFALQSTIAKGGFESELAAIGNALKLARTGPKGAGPFANPELYAARLGLNQLAGLGVSPRWEAGWKQEDQSLDFARQLANRGDFALKTARDTKAATDAQTALQTRLKNLSIENKNSQGLWEQTLAIYKDLGTESDEAANKVERLQEVWRLWTQDKDLLQAYSDEKKGKKPVGAANKLFQTLIAPFDMAKAREQQKADVAFAKQVQSEQDKEAARLVSQRRRDAKKREQERLADRRTFDTNARRGRAMTRTELGILGNSSLTDQEQEVAIAREKFLAETKTALEAQYGKEGARVEANRRAKNTDFAAQFKTDSLRQYNALQLEATEGAQSFGDTTGLVAMRLELARNKLGGLGEAQKAQMLTNQAALLGLQRYGSEYDSLYSQQFELQKNIVQQRAEMTRGLSALQQQELAWKSEDAESAARLAGLTSEQRTAYEKMRPQVEALRQSVRGLIKEQESLAPQNFLKEATDRMALARELNPDKQSLLSIRQQLIGEGWGDDAINSALPVAKWETETQRALEQTGNLLDGFSEAFSSSFDAILGHEKSWGQALREGLQGTLQGLAQDITKSQVRGLLVDLLGGALGGVFGSSKVAPVVTSNPIGNPIGSFRDALKPKASFAVGTDFVPRDGLYMLHESEAIVSASQNRQLQKMLTSNTVSSSGGATVQNVTYIHNGDIRTDNPTQYQDKLKQQAKQKSGPRVSMREQRRRAAAFVGGARF